MSVPDHELDPDNDDAVWCCLCLKMHSSHVCEGWDDMYVQDKYDERESNP